MDYPPCPDGVFVVLLNSTACAGWRYWHREQMGEGPVLNYQLPPFRTEPSECPECQWVLRVCWWCAYLCATCVYWYAHWPGLPFTSCGIKGILKADVTENTFLLCHFRRAQNNSAMPKSSRFRPSQLSLPGKKMKCISFSSRLLFRWMPTTVARERNLIIFH